jgi:hypothetical protein
VFSDCAAAEPSWDSHRPHEVEITLEVSSETILA